MIQIDVRRDSRGQIRELRCSGHAAFDMEGGVDIVCAGVSALMGALVLGLTQVVGIAPAVQEDDGLMQVTLPNSLDYEQEHSAQVLMCTAQLALRELEQNYKGFISMS